MDTTKDTKAKRAKSSYPIIISSCFRSLESPYTGGKAVQVVGSSKVAD
jgi:hypothetical protein